MGEIPDSHPRKASLLARAKLTTAAADGLLAESAMIAHGRGEAFDYLLSEKTSESASLAIREVAARLLSAESPVISLNGNTTVLAGDQAIRAAAILGCPVEVNIYYRTPERMRKLISTLEKIREKVANEDPPRDWKGAQWSYSVNSVKILGGDADGRIEGLEGPRAICSARGIEVADAVLVPLEDGDRCEALVALGKQVLVIDLNPLSRTARMAHVTIVDEVSRAMVELCTALTENPQVSHWDNDRALRNALAIMAKASDQI
ncbi:MAG: phosphopantothenate/pantothenate synthetase [Candidatus Thermoplasmatota archaeon]|nr:phosphopantothenate/pantothenate synthetase [Candidatus Thermoplasmatota archaeon]